tara:strand:- start:395 stop:727 length:333 start_codon:yes stop_codon:yes gene_type:complete
MYEKTFKVWASGCAHVNADKKMGRDSLGEAIIDSEKYFNWDIGINIGDFLVVIFIITFFLGKKFEQLLSQTLVIIDGNPLELINFPFAIFLFVLAVLSFWWLGFRKHKDH